jgi:ADP-dependent phosphofructokinase/glucokinase
MVIIMLSQLIDEKISLLKELMSVKSKAEVNSTYQAQIDAIRAVNDYDIENVEGTIKQKKELLKKSEDVQETERLLAEIDALQWLQAQIVVMTLGSN